MSLPRLPRRSLLLHADDFGMNAAVNAGILRALESGLLTSTSLLANAPAAREALTAWGRLDASRRAATFPGRALRHRASDRCPPFDLGVHLNLTQGRPLTSQFPAELLSRDGCFPGIFGLFARLGRIPASTVAQTPARRLMDAVANELRAQIEFVTGHGIVPTHLNGHQYIELIPAVGAQVIALAREYGIETVRVPREPVVLGRFWSWPPDLVQTGLAQTGLGLVKRHYAERFARAVAAAGLTAPSAYFGTLHAGAVTPAVLARFLAAGRRFSSIEIGLHPAEPNPHARFVGEWSDPIHAGRVRELEWLCDPQTAELIAAEGCELGRLFRLPPSARRRTVFLGAA